jgi:predicted HTH transcriptional regulator
MDTTESRTLVYAGREERNREYKASFPWDRNTAGETMARVTKSILALSNLRDGGHIVIGVDPAHLGTFSFDNAADFVRNYAEPYARFSLEIVPLDGKKFVVLSVEGFDEYPVICKKSFGNVLAEGIMYVRPLGG